MRQLVWILRPSPYREKTKTNICFVVYCLLIWQRDETQIECRKKKDAAAEIIMSLPLRKIYAQFHY